VRLATLLEGLARDRQLLGRMSANALQYFASCPTWAESAETIRGFLLRMVSAR
jgi:hypothetical protein